MPRSANRREGKRKRDEVEPKPTLAMTAKKYATIYKNVTTLGGGKGRATRWQKGNRKGKGNPVSHDLPI